MGTILQFRIGEREQAAGGARAQRDCEIVIFPGVRIERAGQNKPDSGSTSTGHGKLDGTNGRRRPRKTS
jgi:hypothetical protein